MIRKILLGVVLFTLALPVAAQVALPARERIQNIRQNVQDVGQKLESRAMEERAKLQVKKEDFQNQFEAKRDEAKKRLLTESAKMKNRLLKVKDEKKRQAVERIADQVSNLNSRLLDHFKDRLDQMGKVLERISTRADKAQNRGLNVSSVRTAISDAQKAIDAARVLITAQAGKVYSVVAATSTEGTLKRDVGGVRQAFHGDMAKVKDAVKAAHDAVRRAAVTLAQIHGVDEEPSATSTPPTATSSTSTL